MIGGIEADQAAVQCSCLEYDLASRLDCSAAAVAAILGDIPDAADTADDQLAVRRDCASVDTVRDCWADRAGLADCHSLDTEPSASNFLVNTEIEVDTGPSCTLHAVACEAKDSLASAAVRCCWGLDSSFVRPSARPDSHPDCVAAAAEVLAAS